MENFKQLIENIKQIHQNLQKHATSAVNQALTIRNWLIGFYIVEFEQNGEDRAVYGVKLLAKLAASLQIKGLTEPELSRCRQFYQNYPQILGTLSQNFRYLLPHNISVTLSQKSEIEQKKTSVSPEKLLSSLSYSHFTELIKLDDPLKRIFYELECIKGTWSVRELRRQMNSLYFERSGLSKSPEKLSEQINRENIPQAPIDIIKNNMRTVGMSRNEYFGSTPEKNTYWR